MPNWTTNKIIMNGNTEDIKKLRKTFGKKFSFNGVIPTINGGAGSPRFSHVEERRP